MSSQTQLSASGSSQPRLLLLDLLASDDETSRELVLVPDLAEDLEDLEGLGGGLRRRVRWRWRENSEMRRANRALLSPL